MLCTYCALSPTYFCYEEHKFFLLFLLRMFITAFLCSCVLMSFYYSILLDLNLDPWSWPGMTGHKHYAISWVFAYFQTEEHKNKSFIECSNVCSSELDIPLSFQCMHFQC